jgi:hypothetical protein
LGDDDADRLVVLRGSARAGGFRHGLISVVVASAPASRART